MSVLKSIPVLTNKIKRAYTKISNHIKSTERIENLGQKLFNSNHNRSQKSIGTWQQRIK